jgi:hypothetical protein
MKVVEKTKTHILCSIIFSRKSCSLWHNIEKYGGAWQATDDNTAHVLRMLDNQGYTRTHARTHSLRIFNTHCFFTATVVSRTHLNAALYVHCLCCDFCDRNTQHCWTFALCVHFVTTHFCKQLWCMSDLVFAPRYGFNFVDGYQCFGRICCFHLQGDVLPISIAPCQNSEHHIPNAHKSQLRVYNWSRSGQNAASRSNVKPQTLPFVTVTDSYWTENDKNKKCRFRGTGI